MIAIHGLLLLLLLYDVLSIWLHLPGLIYTDE